MFVDTVQIHLKAGKGGNGVVAWRREKFIPKGGPAGGDGGEGGSVWIEATSNEHSFESYRHTRIIQAESGRDGGGRLQKGKNGKDIIVKVPCGTLIKDPRTKGVILDLVRPGERHLLCQGGKGGKGNNRFKSPTRQAPNFCTPGTEGTERQVEFELKLIADVGLVGYPNAGKSTLLKTLTKVPVKIAPYPFTTLIPNLGFIEFDDYSRVLIADIPGIIENAHQDKGLGLSFLKHIERTQTLLFVIDISGMEGRDPIDDFLVLQKELLNYQVDLAKKPFLVVLNKIDEEMAAEHLKNFQKRFPELSDRIFPLSALLEEGLFLLQSSLKKLSHFPTASV